MAVNRVDPEFHKKVRRHPDTFLKEKGFGEELSMIRQGKCPVCRDLVKQADLKDQGEVSEFGMSGLCGPCQRKWKKGAL